MVNKFPKVYVNNNVVRVPVVPHHQQHVLLQFCFSFHGGMLFIRLFAFYYWSAGVYSQSIRPFSGMCITRIFLDYVLSLTMVNDVSWWVYFSCILNTHHLFKNLFSKKYGFCHLGPLREYLCPLHVSEISYIPSGKFHSFSFYVWILDPSQLLQFVFLASHCWKYFLPCVILSSL